MAALQIPCVTLEDLQKFQANHFFGAATSPAGAAQSDTVEKEEELYYEEEDLGYYKDGTKRTLTDEQIEIFRHSEIHALLRERERLREEEAEEQSDVEEANQSETRPNVDNETQSGADSRVLKRKSIEASESSSAKRPKDEDGKAQLNDDKAAANTQQTTSSGDFHFGRKVVSYADY